MYNCYYSQVVSQYLYYADKGYYTIDKTKDYSQQKTTDSNGNETTWADLFVQDTITQLKRTVALYEAAQKSGLTITDSQQNSLTGRLPILNPRQRRRALTSQHIFKTITARVAPIPF